MGEATRRDYPTPVPSERNGGLRIYIDRKLVLAVVTALGLSGASVGAWLGLRPPESQAASGYTRAEADKAHETLHSRISDVRKETGEQLGRIADELREDRKEMQRKLEALEVRSWQIYQEVKRR